MIETIETLLETSNDDGIARLIGDESHAASPEYSHWRYTLRQFVRFSSIGALNTCLDLLVLNGLLFFFPTTRIAPILIYNVIALSVGALNSFFLNRYWTFGHRKRVSWRELRRFAVTALPGICCTTALVWLISTVPHTFLPGTVVWLNAAKIVAVSCTALLSYVGMRVWVFVRVP